MSKTTLINRLPEMTATLRRRIERGVRRSAERVRAEAVQSMSGEKSGQMYGAHQASAPGEAPAIDTGALANSVQAEREAPLWWAVYTSMAYAPLLEFGTARVAPRPFLGPAVEAEREAFARRMAEAAKGEGA